MSSNSSTPAPHHNKKREPGWLGGRDEEGGGLANPSFYTTPAPSFPPSLPFPAASHPSPQPPKVGRPQRKPKKKFSTPDPGGRSASLLFAVNPQSPDVTRSRSQSARSAAAAAGGGGGSPAGPSSRTPGPRGGREGTVPYKPQLSGLRRPHRQCCTGGGEGTPDACQDPQPQLLFRPLLPLRPSTRPFPHPLTLTFFEASTPQEALEETFPAGCERN